MSLAHKSIMALALIIVAMQSVAVASAGTQQEKLSPEERLRLTRDLTAEYATATIVLPRAKKPLPIDTSGNIDLERWTDAQDQHGPAARAGDLVQITKVEYEDKKLILEINGGFRGGRKWWHRIRIGGGVGRTSSIPTSKGAGQTIGTSIALLFPNVIPVIGADEVKEYLKPILDFEQRTVTEQYIESLPEPIQAAIEEKRAVEEMEPDALLLALGKPDRKVRETKDGVEYEDWIYGTPPGKIVFVTFRGKKVIKVSERYAGLGGSVAETAEIE